MDIFEHRGYRDFVWNVELHQFGLEIVGLWPSTAKATTGNIISDLRVAFTFVSIGFLIIIPLVSALTQVWGNMILVIENLQVTLPIIMTLVKVVVMRNKRTVVLSILKMMAEDWVKSKEAAERKEMIRRARNARLIIIFGYTMVMLAYICVIILPLFGIPYRNLSNLTDRNRLLPLQTYYFYDTDKSPQYEFTLIGQALGVFLAALTYATINSFLGLVVLHIYAQFEIFKRRLSYMIAYKDFDSALRNNINSHLRLIRFVGNIEDVFVIMMFGLVLFFGAVFCLYGFMVYTILTGGRNNVSLSQLCFVVIGGILLIAFTFFYCGAGEIVANQSESVRRVICDLEWYNLEPKKGKMLILLMIRTNEPLRITAGKMIPLTMATFGTLLKTSAGYISLLLASQK